MENTLVQARIARRESEARFVMGTIIASGVSGFAAVSIALFLDILARCEASAAPRRSNT